MCTHNQCVKQELEKHKTNLTKFSIFTAEKKIHILNVSLTSQVMSGRSEGPKTSVFQFIFYRRSFI